MTRTAHATGGLLAAAGVALVAIALSHYAIGIRAQAEAETDMPPPAVELDEPVSPPPRPDPGELVGRIEIPRVGLNAAVFEGVSSATLHKGPGHLPESPWPGAVDEAQGNCVIAGHRDSFFRSLRDAREGDLVLLSNASGSRRYRLDTRRIVSPDDVSALEPTAESRLTLITCYPFTWVGAAPQRLVWSASEVSDRTADASAGRARLRTLERPLRLP